METVYAGKLVRIRPFQSAAELYNLSVRLNSETHDALFPIWFPRLTEEQLFEPDGFFNLDGICGFGIELLDSGELVGIVCCFFDDRGNLAVEVGTTVDKAHRRRGFGTEAKQLAMSFVFEHFPVERVEAMTFGNNPAAQRSLELCGMHCEGIRRSAMFSRGRHVDCVYYVIFREDWEQLPVREIVRRGQ